MFILGGFYVQDLTVAVCDPHVSYIVLYSVITYMQDVVNSSMLALKYI